MAEDYPSESQGLFSSVLGLVSREIQDFVVTAVTGSSATLSHSSSQNHGPSKHKRSRSVNSGRSALPSEQIKRKRRPSSPHPKNPTRDGHNDSGEENDEDNGQTQSQTRGRYAHDANGDNRPGPSKRPVKALRRISMEGGVFKMPELPSRPTMPGSLWPRSPTPAEWNGKALYPDVPAPTSIAKSGLSTTPTTSPNVRRDPSPEPSRPPKRPRSRRRSSVRFAPQVVRHAAPPERSPTPGVTDNAKPTDSSDAAPEAVQQSQPSVKVEEDDEIVVLDKMPTPPHKSTLSPRKKVTQVPNTLGSFSTTPSPSRISSERGSGETVAPSVVQPRPTNLADMSVSELTSTTTKPPNGNGKGSERRATVASEAPRQDVDSSNAQENNRIRQLEEEIERLKNELSFHSSTNSSTSMPPPPPPAPPLPPPGYIAIPATSWANGQHPSQRGLPQPKLKPRKSLQSIVPAETLEKFLSELKTVKLRNTGSGTSSTISPYTARQAATSAASAAATSEMSAGLQSLRAGLKRKHGSGDASEELQNGLHEAVRRRFETASPTHEVHESHDQDNFVSQASSSANSVPTQSLRSGRSDRSADALAISWSYPGPIRPVRAPRPEEPPAPSREPGLHRSLAAPPVPLPLPGQGGSDMTTPSLCSDTEVDPENEQDSLEQYPLHRDEALTPPAEDDIRPIQPADGASKLARGATKDILAVGRKSDLRLDELNTFDKVDILPKQIQQRDPKPAPNRTSVVRRVSHPLPVQGSPNVFLARQPKSPLPAQHVRKPLPPARTTSRRDTAQLPEAHSRESDDASSAFRLHTSAVILQPEPDVVDGDVETEPLVRPPTSYTPAYEEYTVPIQVSTPALESSVHQRAPTPGLKLSQLSDPKGKRRADGSISLEEEMRRVAANERIADLDIDLELEGMTDADVLRALESESTVYVGMGNRSKAAGFVSGGGAAGIAVTMDPGHRGRQINETSSKMRSRIPVPKSLSRSR